MHKSPLCRLSPIECSGDMTKRPQSPNKHCYLYRERRDKRKTSHKKIKGRHSRNSINIENVNYNGTKHKTITVDILQNTTNGGYKIDYETKQQRLVSINTLGNVIVRVVKPQTHGNDRKVK
uniref:Uncharacterized protein n=1 Tax=Cacopsylla melanoneura TaxID=428564 RepID=A0A8D8S0N1_9HEMI